MNAAAKQLYDHALHLSDSERAELAAMLIESLDSELDQDVEQEWDKEIQRRTAELDQGVVHAIPWPEARRMILGSSDVPSAD